MENKLPRRVFSWILALIHLVFLYLFIVPLSLYAGLDQGDFFNEAHIFGSSGGQSDGYWGFPMLEVDINNDGIDDVIVGNSRDDSGGADAGAIYIYHGGSSSDWDYDVRITSDVAGGGFGFYGRVVSGDLNGDGYQDLVSSSPGNSEGGDHAGKVYVFLGENEWASDITTSMADVTYIGNSSDEKMYGQSLAVGDYNGDGLDDLAVSVRTSDVYSSKVYIYWGALEFSISQPDLILNNPISSEYLFGFNLYADDLNGDGYSDLAIAHLRYRKVHLYLGGENISTTPSATFLPEISSRSFGYRAETINTGYINADDIPDLCISDYRVSNSYTYNGAVYCWYGRSDWSGDYPASAADIISYGKSDNENYGRSVNISDLNNDGYNEFIVGAYQVGESEGRRHGSVYIYPGNENGIDLGNYFTLGNDTYDSALGNVVRVVDLDNDGYASLLAIEAGNNTGGIASIRSFNILHPDPTFSLSGISYTSDSTPDFTGNVSIPINSFELDPVAVSLGTGYDTAWDTHHVYSPSVVYKDGSYHMWYSGYASTNMIGYATSPDGVNWVKYDDPAVSDCGLAESDDDGCVFSFGGGSFWDNSSVMDPEVIWDSDAGVFKLWYTGSDGTNERIGYATSADGISWTRYDDGLVASCGFDEAYDDGCIFSFGVSGSWDSTDVASPTIVKESSSSYKMYYSGYVTDGNTRMGLATSTDGINWTRYDDPALEECGYLEANDDGCLIDVGFAGEADSNSISPDTVFIDEATYKGWYSGSDGEDSFIFYMTSSDGISWSSNSENPVLEKNVDNISPDQRSVLDASVVKIGSDYELWYSAKNSIMQVAHAISSDGVSWIRTLENKTYTYDRAIAGVQWSLSNDPSGNWNDCVASDGLFDSASEGYECSLDELPEGDNDVYTRFYDDDGLYVHSLNYQYDDFIVDATAPAGSLQILGESVSYDTSDREVELIIDATDAISYVSELRVSEDQVFADAEWETYATNRNFILSSGEGDKTVYIQFRDPAGNESLVFEDSIVFDATPPVGAIVINSGDAWTNNSTVELSIIASDNLTDVVAMKIENDAELGENSFQAYETSYSYELSEGDGLKYVYVQFLDHALNTSALFVDTIKLDSTGPTGSIVINSGDHTTTDRDVELNILASDNLSDVTSMRISTDQSFQGVDWETYDESDEIELEGKDEEAKYVYVQFKDSLGNESAVYFDRIIYRKDDSSPIYSEVTIDEGNTEGESLNSSDNEDSSSTGDSSDASELQEVYSVSINVVDQNDQPVSGVVLKIDPLGIVLESDENGEVEFEVSESGVYTIYYDDNGEDMSADVEVLGVDSTQKIVLSSAHFEGQSWSLWAWVLLLGIFLVIVFTVSLIIKKHRERQL
ncbi:hypothetical protein GF357_03080 [Candidatus Dojkabacteria bacterium]|nr:hypothetical protein [Candidatus Dojkabacteria bacterium]